MDDWVLYLIAFIIGLIVASAEIISRYRDEPVKALGNWYGILYLFINGIFSIAALFLLFLTGQIAEDPSQRLLGALGAGFGAMIILRTKFFTFKSAGGEEISIGPGNVIDSLLNFIDKQIDRKRAINRTELVREVMEGIDFDKAKFYVSTLILGSMQNLSDEDKEDLGIKIKGIEERPVSPQEKSYALGYLILDFMGENFLKKVFKGKLKERFQTTPSQSSDT